MGSLFSFMSYSLSSEAILHVCRGRRRGCEGDLGRVEWTLPVGTLLVYFVYIGSGRAFGVSGSEGPHLCF